MVPPLDPPVQCRPALIWVNTAARLFPLADLDQGGKLAIMAEPTRIEQQGQAGGGGELERSCLLMPLPGEPWPEGSETPSSST